MNMQFDYCREDIEKLIAADVKQRFRSATDLDNGQRYTLTLEWKQTEIGAIVVARSAE